LPASRNHARGGAPVQVEQTYAGHRRRTFSHTHTHSGKNKLKNGSLLCIAHTRGMELAQSLADDEREKPLVAQMREMLAVDLAALPSGRWPDVTGDIRLLRFLRGFDHHVEKAVSAVRDMLAIRERYGMDEMHDQWADRPCDHQTGDFPHQAAITRLKPGIATAGLLSDGCPICYEPLRLHRYTETLETIGEKGMLEFYLAQCESRNNQLHRLSVERGRLVQLLLVIDMRGVSLWQLTSRRWAKFDEAHQRVINRTLAEVIARIYVINCPAWVVWWYKRIEWWVPVKTRKKVKLLGPNFRSELEQVMGATLLQSFLEATLQFDAQPPEASGSTPDAEHDTSAQVSLPKAVCADESLASPPAHAPIPESETSAPDEGGDALRMPLVDAAEQQLSTSSRTPPPRKHTHTSTARWPLRVSTCHLDRFTIVLSVAFILVSAIAAVLASARMQLN
jgi:hypothetical protein